MIRILFLLCFIYFIEIQAVRRRCINSGVLFPEKTLLSPIVVYGESISKRVYEDSHTQLLYNVTFRVDCVLKGQDIEEKIEITEAGIKSGHMACQWLDTGHLYTVFLERWGMNMNSYRPVDFQESLMDNVTYDLLAKTCHLKRIQPLNSMNNNCPNVSMMKYCPHDQIDMNSIPKQKDFDERNPIIKSSYFNQENQFYLQSNVTIPKNGFIDNPNGRILSNEACSLKLAYILLILNLLKKIIYQQ